jgi:hypothetical protein
VFDPGASARHVGGVQLYLADDVFERVHLSLQLSILLTNQVVVRALALLETF